MISNPRAKTRGNLIQGVTNLTDSCQVTGGGAFTFGGSMEEMIDFCVGPMVEHTPGMTEAAAREMLEKFLPILKRWRAQ